MIDFYSPGLLLASVSLAVAAVALPVLRYKPAAAFRQVAVLASAVGLTALALSVASHVAVGHRPGTAAALGARDFVVAHPATVVIAVAGLVLTAGSWRL